MFSNLLKELENRLRAATVAGDAKEYILPSFETGLHTDEVKSVQFKAATATKLQQLYQGRKPWAELPELVYSALEPFANILDTLWSENHGGLLSSAVSSSEGIYHLVKASKDSSQPDGNDIVPRIDTAQTADYLDALEAPLTWLDDLHSKLSMLLKEPSQGGERPLLLSLIADLTDAVEKCNSICNTPDFGSAYEEDDRCYKTIIAAEEFHQRAYDERSAPNYFKHCEKSRMRGSRLKEFRNGNLDVKIRQKLEIWVGSTDGWDDYKKAREWAFAVDADYNVLNWTYPPVKDWTAFRGEGEAVVGVNTEKWLKEAWGPGDDLAKDMEIWAAILRRANFTSHISLSTAKCLQIIEQATTEICSLSGQLSTVLQDLFYNLACEAPQSVIEPDIKELQKLYSAFQMSVNSLRTYKDPWIDTRFWTGKTTLYSDSKPMKNNDDALIYGISCIDAPPNSHTFIESRWSPERGPYPHCSNHPPFQADIDWLELPAERDSIDHGSMGWGTFADHGNKHHIGHGRKQLVQSINFNKEALAGFVESGGRPTVVAWIQSLYEDANFQCQISVYVDDISQHGFQLHADTGEKSSILGVRVGWLAYSRRCRSLWSHTARFSKKGLHSAPSGPDTLGWGEACNMPRSVLFAEQFELPPRIIGLISTIDMDNSYATRIRSKVAKVTKDCARLHGVSWDDTKASVIGVTFIGRGAPNTFQTITGRQI